jgi:hypothetical protein
MNMILGQATCSKYYVFRKNSTNRIMSQKTPLAGTLLSAQPLWRGQVAAAAFAVRS